jgi:hypothetical protein
MLRAGAIPVTSTEAWLSWNTSLSAASAPRSSKARASP